MRKVLLLLVMSCLVLLLAGCNGAGLKSPTTNPLPGSGTDNPVDEYKNIDANYAIDVIPERELPPSTPIEDPEWDPAFDCLTQNGKCIDEGCINFEKAGFDIDTLKVDFDATFFNPNAENFDRLTVFLVITGTSMGVQALNPDGMMKLDEMSTIEYPYFAFNNNNNPGDNNIPGTMYCYFERNISFSLVKGCDFYVSYEIIPVIDQHDVSWVINPPDPSDEEAGEGGEGRNGGVENGDGADQEPSTPTTDPTDPDSGSAQVGEGGTSGHVSPPKDKPGH